MNRADRDEAVFSIIVALIFFGGIGALVLPAGCDTASLPRFAAPDSGGWTQAPVPAGFDAGSGGR